MKPIFFLFVVMILSSCNKYVVRYATVTDVQTRESVDMSKYCNLTTSYIPDPQHPNATPIRYVRVNFHIMQGANGEGNFNEAEGRKYVKELVNQSNIRWGSNQQMNLPVGNSTDVIPIPIRLVLQKDPITGEDAIYFHRDSVLGFWNRSLSKGPGSLSDRSVIDKYRTGGDSIINVFLIEHVPDSILSPTYGEAKLSGISFIHSVKIFSSYYQYTTVKYRDDGTPFTHDVFYLSKLLNHELGHSFNLNHTWNWDDGCDDTPKNPGCWRETGQSPCEGPISNNMMDYNWNQLAVTPCQLGRMEHFFWKDNGGARQFVIPYWCEYHPFEKVTVYRNETLEWNGGKDLWGDIEIREGATLTIRCIVSLPEQAKVIVKPGAKLILDGGTLTNRCGDQFDGIEIWENKKTGEKGELIISNNGKIENMVHIIEVQQ